MLIKNDYFILFPLKIIVFINLISNLYHFVIERIDKPCFPPVLYYVSILSI